MNVLKGAVSIKINHKYIFTSPEEQKQVLLDAFNSWKGYLEELDDVCGIGVKV